MDCRTLSSKRFFETCAIAKDRICSRIGQGAFKFPGDSFHIRLFMHLSLISFILVIFVVLDRVGLAL